MWTIEFPAPDPLARLSTSRCAGRFSRSWASARGQYCLTGMANGASGLSMSDWIKEEALELCFEAAELRELAHDAPTGYRLNELSWCQESLFAAAWALSLVEELGWPSRECDLSSVFPNMPPEVEAQQFIQKAELRRDEDLVRATDFYYCLDASLRHDELWNGEPVERRYPMVQIVSERRRALDWIMGHSLWSDVSLDT